MSTERDDLEDLIRKCADLADVTRAIAIAARLCGEKLETMQEDLITLLSDYQKEER
jgi:hypothetical protein